MNSIEIAKQKLQESDWAVLSDVTRLQNKDEFIKYRDCLRCIIINNSNYAYVPPAPVAIWQTISQETPNV